MKGDLICLNNLQLFSEPQAARRPESFRDRDQLLLFVVVASLESRLIGKAEREGNGKSNNEFA